MAKGIQRTRYVDASKLFDSNDDEFLAKRGTRHRQDNNLLLSTDFILAMFRDTAVSALDLHHNAIATLATASGKDVKECEALAVLVKPLQAPDYDENRVATDDIRELEIRLHDADIAVRTRRPAHYKQGENAAVTARQEGLADILSLSPILRDKNIPRRIVKVTPQISNLESGIVNTGIPTMQVYYRESMVFGELHRQLIDLGKLNEPTAIPADTITTIPPVEPQPTNIVFRPRYMGGSGEDCGPSNERNGIVSGDSHVTPQWSVPTVFGRGAVRGEQVRHHSSSVVSLVNPQANKLPLTIRAALRTSHPVIRGVVWIVSPN